MDKLLYLSMAAGTAALIFSVMLAVRVPKQAPCVFKIEETKTIFGMTLLSVLLGYGVEIYKIYDPSVGGTEKGSYGMIAVIGFAAILIAAYTVMYTLIKKIYVYDDRLVVIDELARIRTVYWGDIVSVERPGMQRAAKFTCADDYSFTVSGANRKYKQFMNYLEPRLKSSREKNLLKNIEKNLM